MTVSAWKTSTVGDLIDGLEAGVSVRSDRARSGGPSVLKTSSIGSGKFDPSEAKPIVAADIGRARCRPERDSVIVSRMNTPALVGEVGYVNADHADLFLPDRLWLARPQRHKPVDMRWLSYYLSSNSGSKAVRELATGTSGSMKNIPKSRLLALEIPLPPVSEQRAIATSLADVDELIATLERLIAKKQAVKQGMMQQLLTGQIRLPGFSDQWADGALEQLAVPSKDRAMPWSVPPMTPLVELEQIEAGSGRLIRMAEASSAVSLKATFRPGDVLFGKLRAYLRKFWYANVDGLCTTEIWVLRPRPGVHGKFVRYVVEADRFIDAASGAYGTHMPRSDWRTVRDLAVAIPPYDEQVAIASALEDVDLEIDLLHQRFMKTRDVKHGMMQELISGRIRLPIAETAA